MKYSFLILIIGLVIVLGAFLIIQNGQVSPFNIEKLQELIETNQIPENDPELFEQTINTLIKTGQIETYLNTSSIIIFATTISVGLFMIVFGIHTIIDKLFARQFFEKADYKIAARRSFLFTFVIVGTLVLRFFRVEWNSVFLIIPFALIVELAVIYFTISSKHEEIDIEEEKIDKEEDEALTKIEEAIEQSFENTHRGDIREELRSIVKKTDDDEFDPEE